MRDSSKLGIAVAIVALAATVLTWLATHPRASAPKKAKPVKPAPAAEATWPWPKVAMSHPYKGVTRWLDDATEDGTSLELFRFDFKENPKLRFELYDQDEDDALPFDNYADYYNQGVGQVVKHLTDNHRGKILAAWNGLFFAYDRGPGSPPNGYARHIGPVILRGKGYHNVGQFRWSFGVKMVDGHPQFRVALTPTLDQMTTLFDYASIGAQCLIREGKTLKLPAFDPSGAPRSATQMDEVGSIPYVDYIQTSRTSMGWSQDNRYLYLLVVNEPDSETASKIAAKRGEASRGGWTIEDLQRFWVKLGVWGAVNSDGGSVNQHAWLRDDGQYELLPPRIAAPNRRLLFGPDFKDAPAGGTLLTFYVTDSSAKGNLQPNGK